MLPASPLSIPIATAPLGFEAQWELLGIRVRALAPGLTSSSYAQDQVAFVPPGGLRRRKTLLHRGGERYNLILR